jgi:DNA repair protein RecO
MHAIHVTEGITLSKRSLGEANTLVSILTEDMGLLRAKATSTRAEQSKLRYGLEPLTSARFSFVQGKYEWRLTGVEDISRALISMHLQNRVAAGRVTKLLLRLIQGSEEGREEGKSLFKTVRQGLLQLSLAEGGEEVAGIECVLVLRVLSHLGYLPRSAALAPYVEGEFEEAKNAVLNTASRAFIIRAINESLRETGL